MFRSIWKFYLEYAPFISHVHPDFAVERPCFPTNSFFKEKKWGKNGARIINKPSFKEI